MNAEVGRQDAEMLASGVSVSLARIMRPQAAYRWLLPQLASITPQYIEAVLRGALAGNHVQQWELFDLMLDTWPELAACAQELADGVLERRLIWEPYAEEDEDASPEALERCKLASAAMRRMMPDAASDENDMEGTLRDILDGWFRGVTCLEVDWQVCRSAVHGQYLAPRATFWVHPVCFGFDGNGRLGLRSEPARGPLSVAGLPLQPQAGGLVPLPKHKFLVGIHKAKSGTALGGSLLRPLAWWWCAANFSADWLLNLAQVFGLPFRWATYEPHAPQATVDAICTMLQNMGSAGWAAFPTGTTLDLKEASKPGGDHSPQGELLDRADRYARLVVLGQTMSGSQDASKGGGKAFGAVESDVKGRRIAAAAKYVCQVLNSQLVPSILTLNYGDAEECPCVRLITEEQGDLEQAQRDKVLADAGLEIPVSFLRKKYGLPAPCDGEETIGGRGMEQGAGDEKDEGDGWDEEDGALDARELARVAAIEDDAVFARELQKLTGAISAMGNSNGSRKGWDTRGRGRRDEESRIKENIQRGRNAIRHVLATQRDVMNAMSRPDIGPIDFVWERLDKRGNSRGIKHLLERRGAEDHAVKSALSPDETAEKMVEVIALGKIANPDVASGAVVIDHEGFRVVLGRAGKKTNAWLITGFEKRRDGTR